MSLYVRNILIYLIKNSSNKITFLGRVTKGVPISIVAKRSETSFIVYVVRKCFASDCVQRVCGMAAKCVTYEAIYCQAAASWCRAVLRALALLIAFSIKPASVTPTCSLVEFLVLDVE